MGQRGRTAGVIIGGACWAATTVPAWTSRGSGATMNGLELVNWLRTNTLRPDWGPTVAWVMVGVALLGCALVATSTLHARWLTPSRAALGGITLLTLVLLGAFGRFPVDRWGPSMWLTGTGAAALVAVALPFPGGRTSS